MEERTLITVEHVADPGVDRWVVNLNLSGMEPGEEVVLGHVDKVRNTLTGRVGYKASVKHSRMVRDEAMFALYECARTVVRHRMGAKVADVAGISIPPPTPKVAL